MAACSTKAEGRKSSTRTSSGGRRGSGGGFRNAYEISGKEYFLKASEKSWDFIEKYIVDRRHGEWYWLVSRDGMPSNDKYKWIREVSVSQQRMCFEVMERLDKLAWKHKV